jgi:Nif-specific regulatory protein
VVPVVLPPLRDRQEDLPLLIDYFLKESNRANHKKVKLSRKVMEMMMDYPWPGNVRELQNLIERLVIMSEGNLIEIKNMPSYIHTASELPAGPDCVLPGPMPAERDTSGDFRPGHRLVELERQEIEGALARNGWVQARAARELGLTQRQIGYKIKKYGLTPPAHI